MAVGDCGLGLIVSDSDVEHLLGLIFLAVEHCGLVGSYELC